MKRILILFAFALFSFAAVAQNQQAGVRYEVTEVSANDAFYSIFTYVDDEGTFGYYLSLGRVDEKFSIASVRGTFSYSDFDETCLCLGATRAEAFASLDTLLALYDREAGTAIALPARMATGNLKLGQYVDITCEVHKKVFGGKRLWFYFPSGDGKVGEAYLNKSGVKQLRWGLKVDKKLHPDK
jgi:hypothetical protein